MPATAARGSSGAPNASAATSMPAVNPPSAVEPNDAACASPSVSGRPTRKPSAEPAMLPASAPTARAFESRSSPPATYAVPSPSSAPFHPSAHARWFCARVMVEVRE